MQPTKAILFTVNADGRSPKDLGDGVLPSWSPDGKQIACCRYYPGGSVWIMNADGSDKKLIDDRGWSVDWSPKKDELAYSRDPAIMGANLCVYDLKTKQRRNLLEKNKSSRYFVGFCLGRPMVSGFVFKGDLPDGKSEVAIVNAQGQDKGFKVLVPSKAIPRSNESFTTCSPGVRTANRYWRRLQLEGDANLQLYLLDPQGEKPPQKLAGQDPSIRNVGSSWSPDGKKIVISFNLGKPMEQQIRNQKPARKEF